MKLSLGLAALVLLASPTAFARHDDAPTCEEVRKVRAFALRRGLSDDLSQLEAEACGRASTPQTWSRTASVLGDADFRQYVRGPILMAGTRDEAAVCRRIALETFVTSKQVADVMLSVASSNQAACALAFYPVTVDRLDWDRVYISMSSTAEKEVRKKLDELAQEALSRY